MTAIQIIGVDHIPEVRPGDDLVCLIVDGLRESDTALQDSDVVVVTHKIVSKAEGQLVDLRTIEPSAPRDPVGRAVGQGRSRRSRSCCAKPSHRAHGARNI